MITYCKFKKSIRICHNTKSNFIANNVIDSKLSLIKNHFMDVLNAIIISVKIVMTQNKQIISKRSQTKILDIIFQKELKVYKR